MKIGIDIRNIGKHRTGDEVVFFNLVKNLSVIDIKNEYKLFTDITDENKISEIKEDLGIADKNNFEIISLPAKNRFIWNFWTLQREFRKNPVDAYLTQYITPWFVPKKIKILTVIHDISFNFYPEFIKKSDLFFLKTLIPLSLKRSDKIIAVSRFTRDEIIKFYKINPEKIIWIYNAVSEDFLAQNISEEKIEEVKRRYNLPEKFILYLGTLQPRKNLPILVEAFVLFKGDSKLVIAGEKGRNYDCRIDEIVKRYELEDKVFFPGFINENDKAAVIKSAEIFCSPSLYEGFGIPILEAMSAGVPAIVSAIPAHKEISGDAALFFNPEIAGELSNKLIELTGNSALRRTLIAKGKERVKDFSWKKTAEKLADLLIDKDSGSGRI